MQIQELLERGVERHLEGDLAGAGDLYRQVLQQDPEVSDAWNLAGVIAHQTGQHELGIDYIGHAITLRDDVPAYHLNLATALMTQGRAEEAERSSRICLRLDNSHTLAWNVLGNALYEQEETEEAIASFEQALRLDEGQVDAWVNLGRLYRETGRLDDAERCTLRALDVSPGHFKALNNLGAIRNSRKDKEGALEAFQQALQQEPGSPRVLLNMGIALQELGRFSEAEAALTAAVEAAPQSANAWNSLGCYYQALAQVDNALDCFRHAVSLEPDNRVTCSNYLFGLNFAAVDGETNLQEHVRIGSRLTPAAGIAFTQSVDRDRPLRIGYLSPDFYRHPLVSFFEPMLKAHRRDHVHVTCYSNVKRPDEVTSRLRENADLWRDIHGRGDREVLDQIRSDEVDILIELTGHTADNRLNVLAQRAAPVQVSMLGYLNTTGVTEIDYYITDAIRDPADQDRFYTEEVVRIAGGGCCWQAPADAPDLVPPPSVARGYVTFGSTHRPNKLTSETLALWARVMQSVPDARLLIFHSVLKQSEELRAQLLYRFSEAGLDPARIDLAWDSNDEYLNAYQEMDILLEATPWGSGTTAHEAMWMGVPIPTLLGSRPCGRATASALHRLGLTDLIARDSDEYCEVVSGLAADSQRLTALRTQLRDDVGSTLCDAEAFVTELEAAYRDMWVRWCDEH